MSDNQFDPKTCGMLLRSLADNRLRRLRLDGNDLGAEGLEAILEACEASNKIGSALNRSRPGTTASNKSRPGSKASNRSRPGTSQMAGGPWRLSFLSLCSTKMTDEVATPLLRCLGNSRTLSSLHLAHNALCEAPMTLFSGSGAIAVCDLSWNRIRNDQGGNDAALRLIEAIEGKQHIKDLDLSNNSLGDSGGQALACGGGSTADGSGIRPGVLGHERCGLVRLNIACNILGDRSALCLAMNLRQTTTLRYLDARGNNFGRVGTASLLAVPLDVGGSRISVDVDPGNIRTAVGGIGAPDEPEGGDMLLDELSELPFDRDDDERIEIDDAEEDVVSCLQRVHCLENI